MTRSLMHQGWLALALIFSLSSWASAQTIAEKLQNKKKPDQADLIKKKEEVLAGEWVKKAEWVTDYDHAREQAQKEDKLIFTYFTRSYAY